MAIRAVLFDLDGTLLPMDQSAFMKLYFGGLAKKLAPRGYEPKALIDAIWTGSAAMVQNDGTKMNETVFWEAFSSIFGDRVKEDIPYFDDYYRNEFRDARNACRLNPRVPEIIGLLKEKGLHLALATNPLFPEISTVTRTRWAGLEPSDFALITTYENSGFCKPNPSYYLDVAKRIGVPPEECLMVGNDVAEDMIAETVGMQVFLLTDDILNRENQDISRYPSGSFEELYAYLKAL